ncbi:MAG: histidine phosphatase family protein [Planctomycetota bacterium]
MRTSLILIRHGETEWNREGRLQGHRDVPLSEVGHAQALNLAQRLKKELGRREVLVVTSDLLRARQTAAPLVALLNATAIGAPYLRERCFGVAEGFTWEELRAKYPEETRAHRSGRNKDAYLECEPVAVFRKRVLAGLRRIHRMADGRLALAVTHGGAIKVVLKEILGAKTFMVPNTAAFRLAHEGGRWHLVHE